MANQLVPFEGGQLPAYLAKVNVEDLNDDLTAHARPSFAVMSIKGKVFSVVKDGVRRIVPNPKDPDSPATNVDVVLVKASRATNKTFYAKGYDESSENAKPDCWSSDGVRPDASIPNPQSKVCANCPHNQWGSKKSNDGRVTKGKACQDNVRLAIAPVDQLENVMLLRVPPASMRALGEYGDVLKKRGVPYNAVITKISFDVEEATPNLLFKPVAFLGDEQYQKVSEFANGDLVQAVIGSGVVADANAAEGPAVAPVAVETPAPADTPSKSKTVTVDEVKAVIEKASKGEKPTPAPAPKVAEMTVNGLDLSGLSFDD